MQRHVIHFTQPTFTATETVATSRVIVSIGGTHFEGMEAYRDLLNALRLEFDNPIDQARRESKHLELDIEAHAIGEGHTLRTLLEGSDHPAASIIDRVADMDATAGAGSSPAAGFQATVMEIETDDFQDLVYRLRDQVSTLTNGHPCRIEITILISIGGGMGAGAVVPLTQAFEDVLANLGVPVDVRIHAIGAHTFTGLSKTAPQNAPCVLATLADFVIGGSEHSNVCRSLHLTEYTAFGDNSDVRSRLIALDHQALNARSMVGHLQRISPNNSTVGVLGNIDFREVHFLQTDSSVAAIQANCAERAISALASVIAPAEPDTSIIKGNTWIEHAESMQRISVEEIVADESLSASSFVELAEKPDRRAEYRLIWDCDTYGRFDLAESDHHFAKPIESETDLRTRKKLLTTFKSCLSEEIPLIQDDIRQRRETIATFHSQLEKLLAVRRQTRKPKYRQRASDQLMAIAQYIRELADESHVDSAKLIAMERGQQLVSSEWAQLTKQFEEVNRCLHEIVSVVGPQTPSSLVVMHHLSDSLPILMKLPKLTEDRRRMNLCRLAGLVTLDGLANILGIASARVEDIADAVVFGKATYSTPPLGSCHRSDRPATIYVLPTVEKQYGEMLKAAVQRRDKRSVVFFTDNINVGAAVLRYRFRGFTDVESLFPGILKHDLTRALSSDTGLLRFPDGTECLDRLGVHYNSNTKRISFSSLPTRSLA